MSTDSQSKQMLLIVYTGYWDVVKSLLIEQSICPKSCEFAVSAERGYPLTITFNQQGNTAALRSKIYQWMRFAQGCGLVKSYNLITDTSQQQESMP